MKKNNPVKYFYQYVTKREIIAHVKLHLIYIIENELFLTLKSVIRLVGWRLIISSYLVHQIGYLNMSNLYQSKIDCLLALLEI